MPQFLPNLSGGIPAAVIEFTGWGKLMRLAFGPEQTIDPDSLIVRIAALPDGGKSPLSGNPIASFGVPGSRH